VGEYAGIALLHISEGNKEKKGITTVSSGLKKYVPIKNVPIGSYVVEPADIKWLEVIWWWVRNHWDFVCYLLILIGLIILAYWG